MSRRFDSDEVLRQDPTPLLRWIRAAVSRRVEVPGDFDWLKVATWASDQLRMGTTLRLVRGLEPDREVVLLWAEVAVLAYERSQFIEVGMMTRVRMLGLFGAKPGDLVRDPRVVAEWALQTFVPMPGGPPLNLALDPVPESFAPRVPPVSVRLELLHQLAAMGLYSPTPNVSEWLELIR